MNEQLCERCGLYRRYQHPRTNKIYKLCAKCGWEALVKLRDHVDDEEKTDKEQVDEVLDYIPYKEWAYQKK